MATRRLAVDVTVEATAVVMAEEELTLAEAWAELLAEIGRQTGARIVGALNDEAAETLALLNRAGVEVP